MPPSAPPSGPTASSSPRRSVYGNGTIDSLLAEIGVKAKGTNKKDGFYDKKNNDPNLLGLLDWFIEEKPLEQRGLFIAMLRDNTRAVDHCISIDTKRRIIMESSPEGGVFPLERASFDRCVADGFWCIGIAAARKLIPKSTDANSTDASHRRQLHRRQAADANSTDAHRRHRRQVHRRQAPRHRRRIPVTIDGVRVRFGGIALHVIWRASAVGR